MNELFDIFCNDKFNLSEERFNRIRSVDPVFRLVDSSCLIDDSGYLNISLSLIEALWFTRALRNFNISAYPVPERYKTNIISNAVAKEIAQTFVENEKLPRAKSDFNDVEEINLPWWLSTLAYGFISHSATMKLEDIVPGGITICVDKKSGKIMDERELLAAELTKIIIE